MKFFQFPVFQFFTCEINFSTFFLMMKNSFRVKIYFLSLLAYGENENAFKDIHNMNLKSSREEFSWTDRLNEHLLRDNLSLSISNVNFKLWTSSRNEKNRKQRENLIIYCFVVVVRWIVLFILSRWQLTIFIILWKLLNELKIRNQDLFLHISLSFILWCDIIYKLFLLFLAYWKS